MSSLVIVESPAKAKTLARILGNSYNVEASYGHVRDLPAGADAIPTKFKGEPWARLGVNVQKEFEPLYVIPNDKKKYIKRLKEALADADELLLATDEDREGESISWHVVEVLKPKVPVRRIAFHEITKEAILAALENPRDIDSNLVRAQESRRILDRLFGYELSPVLWKKVQRGSPPVAFRVSPCAFASSANENVGDSDPVATGTSRHSSPSKSRPSQRGW